MDSFATFRKADLQFSNAEVRRELRRLLDADKDREAPDKKLRSYYFNTDSYLWITRDGVSSKADSVLKYVSTVSDFGFDRSRFCYDEIVSELQRVRTLDFDSDDQRASRVLARLEYHLTKAYLRYCVGQRFGFVDPSAIFNRLDVRDSDSIAVTYNQLFDIPLKKAGTAFYDHALAQIKADSVGDFMRASVPDNPVYALLQSHYHAGMPESERMRYLCNMERARWHQTDGPWKHDKYVMINLPSMHLDAHNGDSLLSMRIGVGAWETKTPLLTSHIKRIDFNPNWVIPKSIVKKTIAPYAGNTDYFERHNYFIMDRRTGKEVPVGRVSADMLLSKDYAVAQRGGKGNPLGSIIFRFDNNFSVFIHHTSNTSVFERNNRSVSHGCIRVERPYDLALFVLKDKNEETAQKISYTMNLHAGETDAADDDAIDRKLLLHSLPVKPTVPLFITYYTLYPDRGNTLRSYADIYGFDKVIYEHLQNYLRHG